MRVKMHSGVLLLDTGNLKFVIENTIENYPSSVLQKMKEKAND